MKIIIAGSRNYNDYEYFKTVLDREVSKGDILISGGANGADSMAEKYARENGIEIIVCKAKWNLYGNAAGPIRNRQMLEMLDDNDKVIAFWDGKSKGTYNMCSIAKEKGINVRIEDIH